ncbi:MAG TPA: hypothetical protein DER01_22355 [Phycisphaerales bacterium]|nr:hypothetical protein [Phycisphaerales bacterium]
MNSDAAWDVVSRYDCTREPGMKAHLINFEDDSQLEMYVAGLTDADTQTFAQCMLALREITRPIAQFIFEMIRTCPCMAIPIAESGALMLPDAQYQEHLFEGLEELFEPVVVRDADHVMELLGPEFEQWEAYREQVMEQKPYVDE